MRSNRSAAVFWGLLLIAAGVVFLLGNLELLPAGLLDWWPALVVVAGLWLLGRAVAQRRGGGLVGGVVLLALGSFWLLENLGMVDDRVLVPLVLIAVGLGWLLRSLARW